MTERTLSILKPDATRRNLTGKINAKFEDAGLRIVAQKRLQLSEAQAGAFYAAHAARPFYKDLVSFMTSGPVVAQVLEGENDVPRYREVMGATNPENAAEGTIRKLFALNVGENSVHGSDSDENAALEIAQFFTEADIVGMDLAARAGYDPAAGITLWQKMLAASQGAPPQWLSTHPAGDTRIREIRAKLPKVQPLYARADKPPQRYGPPPA